MRIDATGAPSVMADGVGAEAGGVRGGVIVVGWKFQHMSNAYTAQENPGLDVNLFYLGLLHRRR